jgi:hypothetical protein
VADGPQSFLCEKQIKASDAIKKNPRQCTRLGSTESLPHLFRLLGWAAGVSGDGVAALPAYCDFR